MSAVLRLLVLAACMSSCSTPNSNANHVCAQLVEANVAEGCRDESDPREVSVRFDLVGSGSHGIVYAYDSDQTYHRALQSFGEIDAIFAEHDQRPHRFHHDGRRVTVMLVHGADARAQQAAQRIVDEL